jgi:hypothetical protein
MSESDLVARMRRWVATVRADVVEAYRKNTLAPPASEALLDALDETDRVMGLVEIGLAQPAEAVAAQSRVRELAKEWMDRDPGV